MSDRRRSAHRKAARGRSGSPSALPPLLVAGVVGGSAWATSVAAEVPVGGAGTVGAVGLAGAVLWARRRDRAAEQALIDDRDKVAEAARAAQIAQFGDVARQLCMAIAAGRDELAGVAGRAERGEQVVPPSRRVVPAIAGGPFDQVGEQLRLAQGDALEAVCRAAEARRAGHGAELLVSVARRLHALVHRALKELSDIQQQVEDPKLLHDLFAVDNLVTRTRRSAESIAVLGGHVPRQVDKPMGLANVLRQAIAEIEQFRRARQVVAEQIAFLDVPGYAAPDVIHLLAELIENATKFSAPETTVTVRASMIPAGVVVEIDDRGLTMAPDRLTAMNELLLRPEKANRGELLERGTIGLLVAAMIAKRHGIKVDLQNNILGGTQALVVLPKRLLVATTPAQRLPVQSPPPREVRTPMAGAAVPADSWSGGGIPAPAAVTASPAVTQNALPRRRSGAGQSSDRDARRPELPRRGVVRKALPDTTVVHGGDVPQTPPNPDFVRAWKSGQAGPPAANGPVTPDSGSRPTY
ncbi:sensor histidine kinase [Streptomyces sp. NPDC087532]|uniref:sensor histidine kinase n=1 Tax=Streptomyces sp. NPDC087532 TaxID=3365795 RepID=UPI0037F26E5D